MPHNRPITKILAHGIGGSISGYINDIDIRAVSLLSKFADDTKVGRKLISEHDAEMSQRI